MVVEHVAVRMPLSIAPMMDRTDRHFRWLMRRITRRATLYTPMIPARALLDDPHRPWVEPGEGPLVLQLGGCDRAELVAAARIAESLGVDGLDLNCGCPSPNAERSGWGAALMARPARVAELVAAMIDAVAIPVSVKHRIGLRGADDAEHLFAFVDEVAAAGCRRFTVHARAAVLGGWSSARNLAVPPLRPAEVHALARARPELQVVISGGILDLDGVRAHLGAAPLAGVMVGRAAYEDPLRFASADSDLFGDASAPISAVELGQQLRARTLAHVAGGGRAHDVTRHALGLWRATAGARRARAAIASLAHGGDAGDVLARALAVLRRDPGDQTRCQVEK